MPSLRKRRPLLPLLPLLPPMPPVRTRRKWGRVEPDLTLRLFGIWLRATRSRRKGHPSRYGSAARE